MSSIVITQSNYIPWKGYFDGINTVDELVLYDDMQYTRRDWRNRNLIKTKDGLKWLTIPVEVKGKYFQKINETRVSDRSWARQHWSTILHNYSKAAYFTELKPFFEDLYRKAGEEVYLSRINYLFIQGICELLGITTTITWSHDLDLSGDKTGRLVNLCAARGASDYYSGPAAKNYLQEPLFEEKNIRVHYFDYSNYPEYRQLHPPFEHGVSILDLLFNEGPHAKNFMKSFSNVSA